MPISLGWGRWGRRRRAGSREENEAVFRAAAAQAENDRALKARREVVAYDDLLERDWSRLKAARPRRKVRTRR